jgi:hypothetical protein
VYRRGVGEGGHSDRAHWRWTGHAARRISLAAAERDALTRELREILAAQESPEEARAFADAPLNEQRNFFGLGDPGERVVPKVNVDEYNDAYGASPTS